ncbi:hypothetical protein ACHAO3_002694 [Verticillium nonalfalfae]
MSLKEISGSSVASGVRTAIRQVEKHVGRSSVDEEAEVYNSFLVAQSTDGLPRLQDDLQQVLDFLNDLDKKQKNDSSDQDEPSKLNPAELMKHIGDMAMKLEKRKREGEILTLALQPHLF